MVEVNRNNLLLNPTRSSPGPVVKVLENPKIPLLLWAWSKGMAVVLTNRADQARAMAALFRGRLRRWPGWCSRWWGS
jgi:hypothetical protein